MFKVKNYRNHGGTGGFVSPFSPGLRPILALSRPEMPRIISAMVFCRRPHAAISSEASVNELGCALID